MNQFYYETRAKEIAEERMKEGMQSQAVHQAGAGRRSFFRGLPRLILIFAGILGLVLVLLFG